MGSERDTGRARGVAAVRSVARDHEVVATVEGARRGMSAEIIRRELRAAPARSVVSGDGDGAVEGEKVGHGEQMETQRWKLVRSERWEAG